ncbi:MAG TPA: nuclear transport factor 2 family protein [Candidatus Dormibacteraeota bacterium]
MGATSLSDRVQRLEDESNVLATLYQYAHALDYGPEVEFLDCFLDDGVWERVRVSSAEAPKVFAGREDLTRFFHDPARGRAPEVYFKHLLVAPQIKIQGDEAQVDSYFVRLQEHPDGPYVFAFGRYRDVLRRCPDGRWRIQHRRAETEDTHRKQIPR